MFCKIFFNIFLIIKVIGKENIPAQGAFILAGNHVSYLDPIIFGVSCPRSLKYLAKAELFKNPFFNWLFRHINTLPLKRNVSDVSAMKQALKQLKGGNGLILFPEGTRGTGAVLQKGLAGVGFLARKARVPVIPAFVKGTEKALPKGSKFIKRCRITVAFGQPVYYSQDLDVGDEEMAQRIMRAISSLNLS